MKLSGPGPLSGGMFLITVLILPVIHLFRYSVTSNSVLKGYKNLRIYPFLLDCQICCHIAIHSILILCISRLSILISPFSFLLLFIWAFYFLFSFSSVAQSCPTLCNPMDCRTPGFTVHHQLPELAQTPIINSWSLFSLERLTKGLPIYLFKEPTISSINHFYCLFNVSFISAMIFIIFFLLLTLGFIFFFS